MRRYGRKRRGRVLSRRRRTSRRRRRRRSSRSYLVSRGGIRL